MIIAIVGLGLIGGSLCKALKQKTSHTVWGLDCSQDVCEKALSEGALDRIITADAIQGADVSILCLYPDVTLEFLRHTVFARDSLVMDTCGVKSVIVAQATEILSVQDVRFLGAHPMAGREFSGFDYSLASLFEGASMILTPTAATAESDISFARSLSHDVGFATVAISSPEEHDRRIAFTSQLAHLVSSAYIKSPQLQNETGFSAGSFLDLTRVAKLNEDMWSTLFLMNKEALLDEVDAIQQHIGEYRKALADEDGEYLRQLLRDGRLRKEKSLEARKKGSS